MDLFSAAWIIQAVETITSGVADKLEKDNVKIYRVPSNDGKDTIRIDIKEK